MDSDFPKENEFEAPIPINSKELINLNASALENCLSVPKPECFLKYHGLLAMRLFSNKYYPEAILTAEKGLQLSFKLYETLYPGSPNGYFDNPISMFSQEYLLLLYGGKAIERCRSQEESVNFYEFYFKNGHWVGSIIQAAKRAAKLYKGIGNDKKAIDCLQYVLDKVRTSSVTQSYFKDEIDKLNKIDKGDWVRDRTISIQDYKELAKADEYPLCLSRIDYEQPELRVSHYFLAKNLNVFKTENYFWWAIQSLLYYEEIFADIPEYTFKNYQEINGIPSDFFSGDKFYKNREIILKEKNEKLLKLNLETEVNSRFEMYSDKNIRHLVIDKITKKGLLELVKVVPSNIIVSICDRINQDNSNNRSGLPDLIAYDRSYASFQFIEVKKKGEKLRYHQKLWLDFLRKNGVDIVVCRVI
ncbi:MAG: VRR-NUC domain-containing protein [Candidatus Omnitrophica bacterium]|nr:VRR-NUC domain-containing protein [Candidatus Omnitrophota bacterium]